jgi:hypothetical protein
MFRFRTDKLLTSRASVSNIRADILRSVESNRNAWRGVALVDVSRSDLQAFVKASTLVGSTTSNCLPDSSIAIEKAAACLTGKSANQPLPGSHQPSARPFAFRAGRKNRVPVRSML